MKKKKGREVWVAVSGGFDPVHVGHTRLFNAARALGTKLLVIVNNDHWLQDKKGYVFMPQKERVELLQNLKGVDRVVLTAHKKGEYHSDKSVVRELKKYRPDIFANGGDRVKGNVPEVEVCKDLDITMRFNVGKGGKVQSSSDMVAKVLKEKASTKKKRHAR